MIANTSTVLYIIKTLLAQHIQMMVSCRLVSRITLQGPNNKSISFKHFNFYLRLNRTHLALYFKYSDIAQSLHITCQAWTAYASGSLKIQELILSFANARYFKHVIGYACCLTVFLRRFRTLILNKKVTRSLSLVFSEACRRKSELEIVLILFRTTLSCGWANKYCPSCLVYITGASYCVTGYVVNKSEWCIFTEVLLSLRRFSFITKKDVPSKIRK